MPLFAHPFPPSTNEQASGQPVGRRCDYGQKQDIRSAATTLMHPDC